MSQYRTGTVNVTNGSNSVVGVGTAFLANVPVGSIFSLTSSLIGYVVTAVPDNTHLTLAANYGGTTATGQAYWALTSVTPKGIPYPEHGDIDTATILQQMALKINNLLP